MSDHKCNKEDVLQIILDEMKEMRKDIKTLLQFKWRIVGGSFVGGVLITLMWNLINIK